MPAVTFDLTREAILVKLTIGKFNPSRRSNLIREETAERHNVNPELLEGKARIIRKDAMARINEIAADARKLIGSYTLQWDEKGGYRLCSLKVYDQLFKALRRLENEFMDASEEFIERRDQMAAEAERDLKDILDEFGFPSKEQLSETFKFSLNEMPISDPKDIRLSRVPQERLDEIRSGIAARIEARIESAQLEMVERMDAVVSNVVEQLGKENPRVYDTLIGNVKKVVELIPAMNITGNEEISRIAHRIDRELAEFETADLRKTPEIRDEAARKAQSILDDLRKFRSR